MTDDDATPPTVDDAATASSRPRRRAPAATRDVTPATCDPGDAPAEAAAASPIRPGLQLGRYALESAIARGGMGVVHRAHDPVLGRAIAIKLVRPGVGGTRACERMVREAQALARLAHPNVIAIHDVGTTDDGDVFLAMELVEGETLGAWRRSRPRSLREVTAALDAAGRGLAAAHAAGLVHRDVKPDNIIVGRDGRVRVIDFGLARAIDDGTAVAAAPPVVSRAELTAPGAGTPAYMAPEQHRGAVADALADQYAFCVAAWEVLHGALPFAPPGADALRADKEAERIAPAPPGARVPARVRKVLRRGLAASPAARYPSLDALLAALARAVAAPRRRAMVAVAATAAASAVALAVAWPASPRRASCDDDGDRLAGVWDGEVRAALAPAFVATGRPHAAATAARVAAALDAHAAAWRRTRRDSCLATHVRREQSPEALDLRTACLDQRRHELAALTAVLVRPADGDVVDHALDAALALPPVERCDDVAALRGATPPPADARARARLAALRAALARAASLSATAQFEAAAEAIAPALAEARAIGHAPALADALLVAAEIAERTAHVDTAVAQLREAAQVAAAAREDLLTARALVELLWENGYKQRRPDEALAMVAGAEAALARAGDPPRLRARFVATYGLCLALAGQYGEAEAVLRAGLARLDRTSADPGTDASEASMQAALGQALLATGRHAEARAAFERALALREALHGADHPDASAMRSNVAVTLVAEGRFDDGRGQLERALAIDEANYGATHPQVALSLLNLGAALLDHGDAAAARPYLTRAAAIQREVLGADHQELAMTLHNLGAAALADADAEAAAAHFDEALAVLTRALGPEHPDLAFPLRGRGQALHAAGRHDEAVAALRRALAVQEAAGTAATREGAETLRALGDAELARGDVAAAVAALERCVALHASVDAMPVEVASAQLSLAEALWRQGRARTRARGLATKARALAAAQDDPASRAALADVERWLAAHP